MRVDVHAELVGVLVVAHDVLEHPARLAGRPRRAALSGAHARGPRCGRSPPTPSFRWGSGEETGALECLQRVFINHNDVHFLSTHFYNTSVMKRPFPDFDIRCSDLIIVKLCGRPHFCLEAFRCSKDEK